MMRHLRILAALISALAIVAGLGTFLAYRAYSQESAVVTVNGQGIPPALYERAQTEQAVFQQRYPGYFTRFGDINRLIEDMLIDQEAARRGIACTTRDGLNVMATQVAIAPHTPDGLGSLLLNADVFGIALPAGYLKTPEAQRTPSTANAVATWAANPTIIQGYTEMCTRGRVNAAAEAGLPPNATNDQRNAARDALIAQLRKNANITSSGSVRVNTPTPYITPPVPTPQPTQVTPTPP